MQSSHSTLRRNIISNWFYDVIALRVDALSKQLHQALVFGEDTDVIYLHFCDLNTQFDFTVPSFNFYGWMWSSVISFLSVLWWRGYCESSKESLVFFLWAKESFSLRNCSSRNSTLFSSRWSAWPVLKCNQGGDFFENFEVYIFFTLWSRKLL